MALAEAGRPGSFMVRSMSEDPLPDEVAEVTRAVLDGSPRLRSLIRAKYDSLLALAERIHARESSGTAPSPTSLVHEAFVRLVDQPKVVARGEVLFKACFAQECRRILVDAARRRRALRRGGGVATESIADQSGLGVRGELDLVEVNEAIESLSRRNERMAQIVDLRVFGGLTVAECAETLGVSPRTIDSEWAFARAWLQKSLS